MYVPCLFSSEVFIVFEVLKGFPLNKAQHCCSCTSGWKRTLFLHEHTVHFAIQELKRGNCTERTRLWNIIVFYIVTCVYCSRNKANTVQICTAFLYLISCIQQKRFCQMYLDLFLVVLGTGKGGHNLRALVWVVPLTCGVTSMFFLTTNHYVVWFSQHASWQTKC